MLLLLLLGLAGIGLDDDFYITRSDLPSRLEEVGLAPFTLDEAEEAYALLEKVVGYMDPAWLEGGPER
jgi:hypothetical protein